MIAFLYGLLVGAGAMRLFLWFRKGFEIPWTGPKLETDPLHQVYYTPEEFDVLDFSN